MIEKDKYLFKYPHDQDRTYIIKSVSLKHRQASRIFKKYSNKAAHEQCDCCYRRLGDKQSQTKSIWFNPIEMAFMGPGLPLFFCFAKNTIFLVFLFLLSYAAFCLYSDKLTGQCERTTKCEDFTLDSYTILNSYKNISTLQLQMTFMLCFSFISVFIFQFLRNQVEKFSQKCDFLMDSPSDYSIIIRCLPENVTEADILEMISNLRQKLTIDDKKRTRNMDVNHIVLSYSMQNYREIKKNNLKSFKNYLDQNIPQEFVEEPFQGFQQSGDVCIVVFQRQQSKEYFSFQPKFKQKLLQCLWSPCIPKSDFEVKGEKVFIERAPQPDDIIWQNANVEINEAVKRKTIFNLLGFGLLILGCGVQYGLALAQQRVQQNAKMYLGLISSILISLSNYGILQFLRYASHRQKNLTHTEYNSVLMVKISYLQFLNAGIFLLISKSLASSNNFKITDSLIFQINTIMIVNGLSHTVSVFVLDYFQITNKILLFLGKIGYFKFSQAQANQLYQSPLPDMPYKYGFLIKTLWLTAFYTSFSPLSAVYSLIGLIINYFVEKKLFGGIYSAPQMFSSVLNQRAVQLMEFFPLAMTFGGLVVFLDNESETSGLSFVFFLGSLTISLIIILFPFERLHKIIFETQKDPLMYFQVYQQVESKIETTYEMTNPAYSNKSRKREISSGKMRKRVLVGDSHEIYLSFDQIAKNAYKQKIQKTIYKVKQQKMKNEDKDERYFLQKKQQQRRDINFEQILVREQINDTSELRNLLNDGIDWKKQMRLLQIYNPLKLDYDDNSNRYRENDYKNLKEDKKRVDNLFGRHFQKIMQEKQSTNKKQQDLETVIQRQEIKQKELQQREAIQPRYINYDYDQI